MKLPLLPDDFAWIHEPWGVALQCRPLLAIAPHLFTTRQSGLSLPAERRRIAVTVAARSVKFLTQVHGAGVVILRNGEPDGEGEPEADVWVSNARDVAIAVKAADCVPVLIADRVTGAVAAVHAGWRGTAARAVVAAVERLSREFGCRAENLVVAIGPSIRPCCYEVGSELVDAFAAAGHPRHLIDRWFLARPPRRGERVTPALRLDVAGANRDQLLLAGVPEPQIHDVGLCTAMHLDVLTSFRAEKEGAVRMAGVIRARGDDVIRNAE